MKIYTKTGDDGSTGLYGGARIDKDSPRVQAIGDVDELNAALGVARCEVRSNEVGSQLEEIQCRLFEFGAELADPSGRLSRTLDGNDVDRLESSIDAMTASLPPLRAFILPGGSKGAAHLHAARAVCRRAERNVLVLHSTEPVRDELRAFLNRLSDWLFTAARDSNAFDQTAETEWQPRKPQAIS